MLSVPLNTLQKHGNYGAEHFAPFNDITYTEALRLWDGLRDYYVANDMYIGDPQRSIDCGAFTTLVVRMNPITDFYVRTKHAFNDFLVFIVNAPDPRVVILPCTADPAVFKKPYPNPTGIAHIHEGAYQSYWRGTHRESWRTALVQMDYLHLVRTDHNGNPNMLEPWNSQSQEVKIYLDKNAKCNVHNSMSKNKPSAGCVVYRSWGAMGRFDKNFRQVKGIIKSAPSEPMRTVIVTQFETLMRVGMQALGQGFSKFMLAGWSETGILRNA